MHTHTHTHKHTHTHIGIANKSNLVAGAHLVHLSIL